MTSLQDRVKGHKTERLNQLENIIAINDDGQLDIKHLKTLAKAIVDAHPTKGDREKAIATLLILNDDEQLDLEHTKKIAKVIAKAYDMIDWEKLKKQPKVT